MRNTKAVHVHAIQNTSVSVISKTFSHYKSSLLNRYGTDLFKLSHNNKCDTLNLVHRSNLRLGQSCKYSVCSEAYSVCGKAYCVYSKAYCVCSEAYLMCLQ